MERARGMEGAREGAREGPRASRTQVCRGRARQLLERRWFQGRRCLDIGCNEGLVTLAVAARFGTASMLGVDLDAHLIRNACRRARLSACAMIVNTCALGRAESGINRTRIGQCLGREGSAAASWWQRVLWRCLRPGRLLARQAPARGAHAGGGARGRACAPRRAARRGRG